MGKFKSLIYFNKRTGNVVGRKGYNGYITAQYQPVVANPRTVGQMTTRTHLKVLTQGMSPLKIWIRIHVPHANMSAWTQFIKNNWTLGITGSYPNFSIAYNNLDLTGANDLDLPFNPSASIDSGSLQVSWSDNSGLGNANSDDKMCFLMFNPAKNQVIFQDGVAVRSARNGQMNVPTAWTGDAAETYLYVMAGETAKETIGYKAMSKSFYLGSLTI